MFFLARVLFVSVLVFLQPLATFSMLVINCFEPQQVLLGYCTDFSMWHE